MTKTKFQYIKLRDKTKIDTPIPLQRMNKNLSLVKNRLSKEETIGTNLRVQSIEKGSKEEKVGQKMPLDE